jgi:hypothetical protein
MVNAELAAAGQRLQVFAQRSAEAGTPITVGQPLSVFPARCVPLDHAAIAWAHASGVPAPPSPMNLGAELLVTSEGLAYMTFPVPYVWWRRWGDVVCSPAAVGRPRWGQKTTSVFVADRVPPFEGRALEFPRAASKAFMDLAVQRGAVSPRAET